MFFYGFKVAKKLPAAPSKPATTPTDPGASRPTGWAQPPMVFLQADEHVGDVQLSLEDGVALG
jgi:hypothetical protein